jgi:glycyl-tRNA synthetase beta chain
VEITLNNPEDYLSALLRNHVVADISERRRIIERGIMQLESERNCTVHKDPELLETVTNLVEFPTVVACSFDEKYLDLPKELPVTVMRTHQKYFSTEDKEGNILPHFAVVSNTRPENNETVRRGAERVLRARLEDARFYYADDRKKPLIDYVEDLRNVTFQEKLGSLYDKTERVIEMCSFIAERIHIKNRDDLLRAAKLSRADLVTGVVSEFPELQGYMGKVYALHSGENSDVASAIFEHYLPRSAGDTLPTGEPGAVISLADKIDNIASFFLLDLIPTGSEDPYALRRQAAGIIHILQQKEYPLALDVLIDKALENVQAPDEERKVLNDRIVQFFRPRLEGIFQSQDYSPDIISAVLASGTMVIKDMRSRLDAILTLKAQSGFEDLLTAARRVYNILSRYEPGEVSEELFVESAEKDLHSAAHRVKEKAVASDYNFLFELSGPIHTFFDKVLVMDEDPRIRENRIALLFSVRDVFETLGDFSKIQ